MSRYNNYWNDADDSDASSRSESPFFYKPRRNDPINYLDKIDKYLGKGKIDSEKLYTMLKSYFLVKNSKHDEEALLNIMKKNRDAFNQFDLNYKYKASYTDEDNTFVSLLVKCKHNRVLEYILDDDNKIDIDDVYSEICTIVGENWRKSLLYIAIKEENMVAFDMLIEHGVDIDVLYDDTVVEAMVKNNKYAFDVLLNKGKSCFSNDDLFCYLQNILYRLDGIKKYSDGEEDAPSQYKYIQNDVREFRYLAYDTSLEKGKMCDEVYWMYIELVKYEYKLCMRGIMGKSVSTVVMDTIFEYYCDLDSRFMTLHDICRHRDDSYMYAERFPKDKKFFTLKEAEDFIKECKIYSEFDRECGSVNDANYQHYGPSSYTYGLGSFRMRQIHDGSFSDGDEDTVYKYRRMISFNL